MYSVGCFVCAVTDEPFYSEGKVVTFVFSAKLLAPHNEVYDTSLVGSLEKVRRDVESEEGWELLQEAIWSQISISACCLLSIELST